MRVVLVALSAAVALVLASGALPTVQATTPVASQPCEGLGAYGDAFVGAWEPLRAFMRETRIDTRDPTTISAPEWTAYAELAEELQTALKTIAPPLGLEDWHQFQIERMGFLSTFARSAATMGAVVAGMALSEQTTQIEADAATEMEHALQACPDFADTLQQRAGRDEPTATPAATPDA